MEQGIAGAEKATAKKQTKRTTDAFIIVFSSSPSNS
jgi:hypothetical protein